MILFFSTDVITENVYKKCQFGSTKKIEYMSL